MTYMSAKKILLLGTGGTIAGAARDASDNLGYAAAQLGVEQLLDGAARAVRYPLVVETEQVAQLDSKDMSFEVWQRLAARCAHWLGRPDVQGIVITHGTDTLEETAFFLHSVLPAELTARSPLVLTCAMRPATSTFADGPQNLLDALAVAGSPDAAGVLVVCAGRVHSARHVQKVHTYRLDAFDSGDAGPLGLVEEGRVRWLNASPADGVGLQPEPVGQVTATDARSNRSLNQLLGLTVLPRVELVMSHAGASGLTVRALMEHAQNEGVPLRGIVVAGTGNGTLHYDLEIALLQAQAVGIRVCRATRCAYGQVLPTPGDRIPAAPGLSAVKARIAMMLELATTPH